MVDLSPTIIAKSDQLNADDLLGGNTLTIRVTRVVGTNDKEQPIAINYEGDQGKPYKPGKSMRRVLVALWGKEGEAYVGRSMRLYRDPDVTFGKIKVGGVRISHMTDIPEDAEMALAVKKGAKALYAVKRLVIGEGRPAQPKTTPEEWLKGYEARVAATTSRMDLAEEQQAGSKAVAKLTGDLAKRAADAVANRLADFDADDIAPGPEDSQRGDGFDGGDAAPADDDDFPGGGK